MAPVKLKLSGIIILFFESSSSNSLPEEGLMNEIRLMIDNEKNIKKHTIPFVLFRGCHFVMLFSLINNIETHYINVRK